MTTSQRKQREFQQRQELLLKMGQEIFTAQGESGLSMDNLIAASEYSKGTVYKHFTSKEDLLFAVTTRKFQELYELFAKVATLPLSSREKALGYHVAHGLFFQRFYHESALMMRLNTGLMQEKAAPERKDELRELQEKFQALTLAPIQEGLQSGDLRFPPGVTVEMLAYASQALSFGMMTMVDGACNAPFAFIHLESASRLFDGYNWRPYSENCDYKALIKTVSQALEADLAAL